MKNFLKFSLLIGSSFFIILYPCSDAVSASLGAAAMAAALSGAKDARPKTLVDSPAGPFVGGALAHLPPLPLLDSSAKRSPRSGSAPAGGSGSLHSSHSDGGDGGARARASTMPSAAAAALFRERPDFKPDFTKIDFYSDSKKGHIKSVGHEGKIVVRVDSTEIAEREGIVSFEHEWNISLSDFRRMNDFLEDYFFTCIEYKRRPITPLLDEVFSCLYQCDKKALTNLGGYYTFAFLIYAHAVNRYRPVAGVYAHADDDYRASSFAKTKASHKDGYGEDVRSWNRIKSLLRVYARRYLDGANFFDTEAEKALTQMPVIVKTPECPVCMENINHMGNSTGTFSCKHEFCVACVEEFVKKVPATCPLCRGAISAATCKIKPYEVA